MSDKKWLQFFPHKEPRDIQIQSIDFILDQYDKGKKFIVLEAPVGTGKSAIAITVAKYLQANSNSNLNTAWILTTQKILQKQYQKDFDWLPTIWSKNNYQCKKRFGVSCQLGLWINSLYKGTYCDCIYTKDKKLFLDKSISLTNIQFFINHIEYGHGEIRPRDLLIVDEAHNIESIITDFVSVELNKHIIMDYGVKWIGLNKSIIETVAWIKSTLIPKLNMIKNSLEARIKQIDKNTILTSPEGRNLMKQFDEIDRYSCQLTRCLERFNVAEWVMSTNTEEEKITLKPIFASKYSNKQLFHIADKVLLMSGTILDKDTYCRNIGISPKETAFISLNSPFEKENRPIFSIGSGSLSYKNIDRSLPNIAKAIHQLITSEHGKSKGIIHCHSYKIANYINKHVKTNRFLMHDSSNRMEIYDIHLKSDKPTILLSPSLTEGIDLVDDLSRFQIIVKVPFPYLGDEFIRQKMNRVPGWYEWETAKTIIQASGRSVRNNDDHCITYILDSDFNFFYKKNEHMFPPWYKDALYFI